MGRHGRGGAKTEVAISNGMRSGDLRLRRVTDMAERAISDSDMKAGARSDQATTDATNEPTPDTKIS